MALDQGIRAAIRGASITANQEGVIPRDDLLRLGKEASTTCEKITLFLLTFFRLFKYGSQALEMRRDYFRDKTIGLITDMNLSMLAEKVKYVSEDVMKKHLSSPELKAVLIEEGSRHFELIKSCNNGYQIVELAKRDLDNHWLKHFATDDNFGRNFEQFAPFANHRQLDFILEFQKLLSEERPDIGQYLASLTPDSPIASTLLAQPLTIEFLKVRFDRLKGFETLDKKATPRKLEMAREFASVLAPHLILSEKIEKKEQEQVKKDINKLVEFCSKEMDIKNRELFSPNLLAKAMRIHLAETSPRTLSALSEKCNAIFNGKVIERMNEICISLSKEKTAEELNAHQAAAIKEQKPVEAADSKEVDSGESANMLETIKKDPFFAVSTFFPKFIENLLEGKDKKKVEEIHKALIDLGPKFNEFPLVEKGGGPSHRTRCDDS